MDEDRLLHYIPLVHWHVRRYSHSNDCDDMFQEGVLAILEELQNDAPDPDDRVRRAIGRRLRKFSRSRATCLDKEINLIREEGNAVLEETAEVEDNCQSIISSCWVKWMIDHLQGRQRDCVDLYFREGLTQAEIGIRLDMPQQCVSQAIRGGLKNLRKLNLNE